MSDVQSRKAAAHPLGRARFLARAAEILALVASVAVVGALVLIAIVMTTLPAERAELLGDLFERDAAAAASAPFAGAAVAVSVIPAALIIYALLQVRRLLAGYRQGEIFSPGAAQRLGRIGWSIIALAPLTVLTEVIGRALVAYDPATGAGSFEVSVGDGEIVALILGALLVVIGRVLDEAARIAEENDAFI